MLALQGDGGYPYAVPVNYVYEDGKLWFHGTKSGHKLDAIRRDPKVSFCVVKTDQLVPEMLTTYFRSVDRFRESADLRESRGGFCSDSEAGASAQPG